ncbi:MAG: hypothetical protein M1837_001816 [Sclerophora amabilis]|nr:MAG: hypothetical protein M1837_001816 [Sclerophora amabilis]
MAILTSIQDALSSVPRGTLISATLTAAAVIYGTVLGIYRLYFSPLAKFPGPKLAALTQWYETYYEIAKSHEGGFRGGQFTFQIKKLHEKYGPIVRINPHELHVDDPDYYEVVYSMSQSFDKMKVFQHRFNMGYSTFPTPESPIHKGRRAALAPFFAKRKILGHGPFMQSQMDRICERISDEYAGKDRVLVLNDVFGCLTSDVITNLAFAKSHNFIERPNFQSAFGSAIKDMVYTAHWATQFGWIIPMMNAMPDSVVGYFSPIFKTVLEFRREMDRQVRDLLQSEKRGVRKASRTTIFDEILNSKLPPPELSQTRLQNEAMSMVGAGIETTKWAFTVGCFHILANPAILQRLREELKEAIPDPAKIPSWGDLEHLPFLAACVEESLRLSYGTVQRSPRINHDGVFQYKDWIIPAGVPVGMDTYHMHHNEAVFPDSHAYKPERWLGNPRGPDGTKPLSRYITAFSKGTRMCIGINMAYAELYLGIASLFRRFELQLFETDLSDVIFAQDMVSPQPKPTSKGVRVLVVS